MPVDAPMQKIGKVNWLTYYFAKEGEFTNPGIYFWDGETNINLLTTIAQRDDTIREQQLEVRRLWNALEMCKPTLVEAQAIYDSAEPVDMSYDQLQRICEGAKDDLVMDKTIREQWERN